MSSTNVLYQALVDKRMREYDRQLDECLAYERLEKVTSLAGLPEFLTSPSIIIRMLAEDAYERLIKERGFNGKSN